MVVIVPVPLGVLHRVTKFARGGETISIEPILLPGGRYKAEPTEGGWLLQPDNFDGEPIMAFSAAD